MTNQYEPSGQPQQSGAPEWPAFPGTPQPEQAPQASQTPPAPEGQSQPFGQSPFQQTPPPSQQQFPPQPQQQPQQPQFTQQFPPQQPQQSQQQFGQQPQFAQQQFGQQQFGQAQMAAAPKKLNILGIIALVLAFLGTALACVQSTMVIGWIMLPVALVLGIVALFMKNQGKALAIAAIVIALIGGLIGGVMAVVYYAKDQITGGSTSVTSNEPKGITGNSGAKGNSRENALPIGSTIENKDWEITLNSVDLNAESKLKAAHDFNDPAKPGNVQILVNMTYKYKGSKPEGEMLIPLVEYVTTSGNSISWTTTFLMAPEPLSSTNTMYQGASVTGNLPFEVPKADVEKGTIAVTPGILGDKRFFKVK